MATERKKSMKAEQSYLFKRALIIGVVGGVIWSTLLAITYYFNFTEIAPKTYLLKPWIQEGWTDRFIGHIVSIVLAGIISIFLAIIYYILFQKMNSMWVGIFYGILLWIAIFFLFQPFLPQTTPMLELSGDTWITTLTIFVLYGLFVGFSISYDYHEVEIRLQK
jgi:uncharacterized membrane protein YagU involved in acid resistance